MKKIIAAVITASALLGATQAFAYQQTTVTTTTHMYSNHGSVHNDAWRHEQWVREQQHRRWMAAHHHDGYRGY